MHGYDEDKAKVIARLRRIEGQVRAITQMVEDDKYCIDILTQISASNSALKSVALLLLDDHLNHCVRQASIQGGEVADEKLAEASAAICSISLLPMMWMRSMGFWVLKLLNTLPWALICRMVDPSASWFISLT